MTHRAQVAEIEIHPRYEDEAERISLCLVTYQRVLEDGG
jgi:hypothetical protein